MITLLLGLFFALGAIVLWTLLRSYQHIPVKELKRLARSGDDVAQLLYRAVAYGMSLRALLGSGLVVCAALSLALLTQSLGVWLAVLVLLIIAAVGGLVLVPGGELTRSSLWLSKRAAPGVAWLLERLHPLLDAVVRFVQRHRHVYIHTGLYEKSDLSDLLEQQKGQPDSRISPSEIALLQHSLSFGDKTVADALVPKRVVTLVSIAEPIGPVLMDELTKSGHSRFPVYDSKRDNIVGILYLHDLIGTRRTGNVADVMSPKLTYVHEDFTLHQTLQAFLKTKQHLFLAVNSFEELVGIITIEDVLEQMIGKLIVDEFDRYDDLRAVAAAAAKKEHTDHQKAKTEPKPEPTTAPNAEVSELIE